MSSSTSLCINSLHTHIHLIYLSPQTGVYYTRTQIYIQWCKYSKCLHHIYTESNTTLQQKHVLSKIQCTKRCGNIKLSSRKTFGSLLFMFVFTAHLKPLFHEVAPHVWHTFCNCFTENQRDLKLLLLPLSYRKKPRHWGNPMQKKIAQKFWKSFLYLPPYSF